MKNEDKKSTVYTATLEYISYQTCFGSICFSQRDKPNSVLDAFWLKAPSRCSFCLLYDIASHFLPPQWWNKYMRGTLGWYTVWSALKTNSRLVYFNLAFSPYHLPSVHSTHSLSSINECNQTSRTPTPALQAFLCLTQNWRQLFPKAFSYCSYLLNTITGWLSSPDR